MWWFCGWLGVATAGGDLQDAAEAMLSVDIKSVERRIDASKRQRAAPAAPAAGDYEWDETQVQGELVPVVRLPLEPNSVLRGVTVHRDRAMVTRFLEVDLTKGTHTLAFEGLPLTLLPDGLSASVEAGDAKIVSVETLSATGEVQDTERIDKVRTEAEKTLTALGEVRDRLESLLAQRQYLRGALVPEAATSGQPVAQVRAGLDFVADAERRIAKEIREQQKVGEDLVEVLDPLLIKLEDPLATGQPVKIEVDVAKAGKVRLALRYAVHGAGWAPSYSARLEQATGKITLEVFGVVTQGTGEDWTDCEVALSTADPVGRSNVRELVPWTLGRSGGAGVYGALDSVGVTTGPPVAAATGGVVDSQLEATVQGSGVVVLSIPGKRTIRGDRSPQRLPVGTQTLSATVTLASVPKLAPEVQRRAAVRYDGTLPLLPGPASSFVEGDYVGNGAIQAVLPGETLELAFGTDERIRVTRQLVSRNQERASRKSTRFTFKFRTTLANHGESDATVTVTDQLPMSEDARIEVKVLALSAGKTDPENGTVAWSLAVPSHGEAAIELSFSVTVPDDLAYLAREFEAMF